MATKKEGVIEVQEKCKCAPYISLGPQARFPGACEHSPKKVNLHLQLTPQ